MGFTAWLALIYFLLLALTIFSFLKKKKTISTILLAVIIVSIIVLGYKWMYSPM